MLIVHLVESIGLLLQAWRRQRRATQIQHALVQAGYTPDDLIRLAQLRATVDLDVAATVAAADPATLALSDVLAVWQRA